MIPLPWSTNGQKRSLISEKVRILGRPKIHVFRYSSYSNCRITSGCHEVWENFGNEKIDFLSSLSISKSTKMMKNGAWLICFSCFSVRKTWVQEKAHNLETALINKKIFHITSSIYHMVHLTDREHFLIFPIPCPYAWHCRWSWHCEFTVSHYIQKCLIWLYQLYWTRIWTHLAHN